MVTFLGSSWVSQKRVGRKTGLQQKTKQKGQRENEGVHKGSMEGSEGSWLGSLSLLATCTRTGLFPVCAGLGEKA